MVSSHASIDTAGIRCQIVCLRGDTSSKRAGSAPTLRTRAAAIDEQQAAGGGRHAPAARAHPGGPWADDRWK